jgi:hypothetical protein
MESKQDLHSVDHDRRATLLLGLAGASAVAFGKGSSALAQQAATAQIEEVAEGVTKKVVGEVQASFPQFAKVHLDEFTWQPGARTGPSTMEHAMICEMSQGTLDETKGGKPFTRKKGDIWTCAIGEVDVDVNNGDTPATMRIFRLLQA